MNLCKWPFFPLLPSFWPHPVYHVPVCSHFLSSVAKLSTTPDVGPAEWDTTGRGSTVDEERKRERASTLQLENEASVSETS